VGTRSKRAAAERVATASGYYVDRRAADFRLAEPAAVVDRHLGYVRRVGDVQRSAAARSVDAETVDVDAAFRLRAPMPADEQRSRSVDAADVLPARLQAGHQYHEVVIHARTGNRVDHRLIDHALRLDVLHVDDGALAAHRNRFLQ